MIFELICFSTRSIHPNFDNLTDDDKLSLILANADIVFNSAKACHQILNKRRFLIYREFWTFNFFNFFFIISHIYFKHNVSYTKI